MERPFQLGQLAQWASDIMGRERGQSEGRARGERRDASRVVWGTVRKKQVNNTRWATCDVRKLQNRREAAVAAAGGLEQVGLKRSLLAARATRGGS